MGANQMRGRRAPGDTQQAGGGGHRHGLGKWAWFGFFSFLFSKELGFFLCCPAWGYLWGSVSPQARRGHCVAWRWRFPTSPSRTRTSSCTAV